MREVAIIGVGAHATGQFTEKPLKDADKAVRAPWIAFLYYFWTVNGTENCVFSHINFSTPPPDAPFAMAIVN